MNEVHPVRLGLSLETTREWNEASFSAAGLAPSEHNGEHSAGGEEERRGANIVKNWCPRYELNVRQTV